MHPASIINPIIIFGQEAATNADILNGTRLASAPYPGVLTLTYAATVALLGTNDFLVTVALPGGEIPIDSQLAPLAAGTGNLDVRLATTISFLIAQGGRVVFSVVETGTSIFSWRARFAPI